MSEKSKKTDTKAKAEKTEEKAAPATHQDKLKAELKAQIEAVGAKYEFLVDHKEEYGKVPLTDLLVVEGFDSRAMPGAVDAAFLDSLKKPDGSPHLIEPVVAAWAKERATGKIVRVVVAGRRRIAGFSQCGFSAIETVTKGMTLRDALADTGTENLKRAGLSAWDKAVFFQRLLDSGMSQKEIATRYSISNSNVSQTLSILGLDERVIKIARAGKFGPGGDTICRELAKIDDPDMQVAVASEVIKDPEHIWAASDVERHVKELNDRAAAKEQKRLAREKEKKRLAREAKAQGKTVEELQEAQGAEEEEEDSDEYDPESFVLREVAPIHRLMEKTYKDMQRLAEKNGDLKAEVAKIRAATPHVLKYVELQGELKALEMAVGVKELPKAIASE